MSKSIKNLIIVLLSLALAGGIGLGMIAAVIGVRAYQERYIECDSKELFSTLELVFDVNFPVDIEDVKAAKTSSIDGSIRFLVKFCADHDVVNMFLESVEERYRSLLYEGEHTITTNGWPSPGWARTPIKQGRKYTLRSTYKKQTVSTDVDLYVDTTDKENFLVYLDGSYLTRIDK